MQECFTFSSSFLNRNDQDSTPAAKDVLTGPYIVKLLLGQFYRKMFACSILQEPSPRPQPEVGLQTSSDDHYMPKHPAALLRHL